MEVNDDYQWLEHHNKETTKCYDAMSPISEASPQFFNCSDHSSRINDKLQKHKGKEKVFNDNLPCHEPRLWKTPWNK